MTATHGHPDHTRPRPGHRLDRHLGRFLARRLVAASAVLALSLSACTDSTGSAVDSAGSTVGDGASAAAPPGPDEWRQGVPMEPLTVPTQMVATADRLDQGGIVGGTAGKAALVAAIRTAPDGRRQLEVSAWDGTAWQPADVGPGVPGEAQDAAIAGNDTVTAVGGWTWEAGTVWPYLVISTDRRTWTPVQLPESLNGFWVDAVVADGGRVVALAENDAGDAATVVVAGAGPAEPVVTFLPAVPDGQERSVGAVAVAGDTILVTGEQGGTGSKPPMVFRSTDAGRTWAEPLAISSNKEASAWGIVHLAGGFLVTGNDLVPDDPERSVRATAWFSADGVAWTGETPPEPDGFRWEGHNSALGAPTAAGDYALAIGGSSSSRSSRLYQRQPSGEWIAVAETDQVADDTGRLGTVAPIVEPTGSAAPAGAFVAVSGAHGMVLGRLLSGVWTTDVAPEFDRDPPYFAEVIRADAPWRATIRQRRFLPFGNGGFRTVQEPTVIGLTGNALTALPWDPPEAGDWDDVQISSRAGAQVVLAARITEDDNAKAVGGWFRSGTGRPWQPITGFGAESYEEVDDLVQIGDRWIGWGGRRAGVDDGDVQAMIWTSADGVTWTRAEGDFADGDRMSNIAGICADPAGQPVAVGWVYLTEGTPTAAAWSEQNGRWRRSILPTGPDVRSWFSSCPTIDGRLEIVGSLDGDEQRWAIDAAGGFQPVAAPTVDARIPAGMRPGEAFDLNDIQPVPGGYVAHGRLDTPDRTGPVIWVSTDGSRWSWVPVRTAQPNSSLLVGVDGPDLIVLSGSTNFSQAWRIPDIADVISSIPAPS